jgi:hypothetical protein
VAHQIWRLAFVLFFVLFAVLVLALFPTLAAGFENRSGLI